MARQVKEKPKRSAKKPSPRPRNRFGPHNDALPKTQIMVVDDHPLIRVGFRNLINREADLEVCAEAVGEAEALRKAFEHLPEMVIVDISLQEGSGLDLIRELKAHWPNLKILAVSAHEETLFAERALHAGALGYVNKREAAERLVDAIRKVQQRKIAISQDMSEYVLNQCIGFTVPPGKTPLETLSDRELEVFELMGHGKTTREVADALCLSPKTIESYQENLKRKLKLNNIIQLIQRAVQWVLEMNPVQSRPI